MSLFTVRFEILNPTSDDYLRLKPILLKQGFTKKIKAKNGAIYYLPQGEYRIEATLAEDQILELAMRCISVITGNYRILVTKSAGTAWAGLKLV